MATTLKLRLEAEIALRERARQRGRSQQDLIREALDLYLGLVEVADPPRANLEQIDPLLASGAVTPPRIPFRRAERLEPLPPGVNSIDLLDREDRF